MTSSKFALGLATIPLLADGAATSAISQTNGDSKLTAQEIMEKSKDTYAALTNYSDEGESVATVGGQTLAPNKFTIKMQRPNLYLIDWAQDSGFFVQKGAVWSAGHGGFMKMGAAKPTPYADWQTALGGATGVSGDAAGSIPGTFFNTAWGNQFGAATMETTTRKPDQKIGEVDCFVLTDATPGRSKTLWIGKQDSLIHQIENDTSAETVKAGMEQSAKLHPGMRLPTTVAGDIKSVQTHVNIKVNKPISPAQFEYETSN